MSTICQEYIYVYMYLQGVSTISAASLQMKAQDLGKRPNVHMTFSARRRRQNLSYKYLNVLASVLGRIDQNLLKPIRNKMKFNKCNLQTHTFSSFFSDYFPKGEAEVLLGVV